MTSILPLLTCSVWHKSKIKGLILEHAKIDKIVIDESLSQVSGEFVNLKDYGNKEILYRLLITAHIKQFIISQLEGNSPIFVSLTIDSPYSEVKKGIEGIIESKQGKAFEDCFYYSVGMMSEVVKDKLRLNALKDEEMKGSIREIYTSELRAMLWRIIDENISYSVFLMEAEAAYGAFTELNEFETVG